MTLGFFYAFIYKSYETFHYSEQQQSQQQDDAVFTIIVMGTWLSDVIASMCAGTIAYCIILFLAQRQAYVVDNIWPVDMHFVTDRFCCFFADNFVCF